MKQVITILAFLIVTATTVSAADDNPPIDFNKQVAPIFTKYCTGCHSAKETNGELSLASFKTLMRGGENGAVIVPGQPGKSRLILSLEKKIEPFMPPEDEKAPTAAEIALLKRWIKSGAKAPVGDSPPSLKTPQVKVVGSPRKPIHAVAFSIDGKKIAVARHARIELRSAANRKLISNADSLTGQVNDVGFSADGKLMFAAAGEPGLFGEATLWDAVNNKRLHTLRGHSDSLYAADLNPQGTILATAGYDQSIKLWDTKTGKELRSLSGHNGAIFDLAFHPSGKFLASASADFTIKLWDVATGKRLDTRNEPTKGQNSLAFSPNGQWLVVGGIDNRIRIYKMNKNGTAQIANSRFAHDAPILKLVFSPDGRQLISSGQDRTIKVWETTKFTQIAVLERQPDWVAALAVSPDSKSLLVGRMDGSLAIYSLTLGAGNDTPTPVTELVAIPTLANATVKPVEVKEAEPNDQPKQATPLSLPAMADGILLSADANRADVDLYKFTAKKGEIWIVETRAARDKSPADTKIEILHADGRPVERLLLRAVRDSYIEFRPIDSAQLKVRVQNWEEMQLNQYLYLSGEVCKLFLAPRGPDSGFQFYDVGGKRRCYFDTSATSHAKDEPAYIVEPYLPGTKLADNGLPVFPLYFANDDDGERKLGNDSRVTFTVPGAGSYLVRVTDVRGSGGKDFKYRLTIRQPQPGFDVTIAAGKNASVGVGSGQRVTFKLNRKDNFNGPVRIDVAGLPDGYSCPSPIVIEAGHLEARGVINASSELVVPKKNDKQTPTPDWSKVKLTATATIGNKEVSKPIGNLGTVKLIARPKVVVHLSPDDPSVSPSARELVIAPGTTITAMLTIERHGYDGDLKFDVDNLPHGVIVDNIGLSGILVRAGETRRQIFLTAADWVPETTRTFHAVATGQGKQASRTLTLHVRHNGTVAAK